MDRSEYLKLCQKVSMFTALNHTIPPYLLVKYENIVFQPKGYEITFDKGKQRNTAILSDLKANSIIYAKLERVERYEGNTI